MPANIQLVRKIALSLPDVEEGSCFGTTAFYVRRKLMLRMKEDGETLVVKYPKEKREELIDRNPDVFSVTDYYQNYPAVLVNLLAVNEKVLASMIEGAWRMRAPRALISAFDAAEKRKA